MLMDIKCSVVSSIKVCLTYDNESYTEQIISIDDLIEVEYNANGLRKHACGKVLAISANGCDPKAWSIIVDCSDDFGSNRVRFSPMSILSLNIIAKGDSVENIKTVKGCFGVPYLRIVKGRLQYSNDGCTWQPIVIDQKDISDTIEDQEGTYPAGPDDKCNCNSKPETSNDDGIEPANW